MDESTDHVDFVKVSQFFNFPFGLVSRLCRHWVSDGFLDGTGLGLLGWAADGDVLCFG